VSDGSAQAGGTVAITCSVAAGFLVQLEASLGGPAGGTLSVAGTVSPSSGGTAITADLASADGEFTESDCTVLFTYEGQPVPATPPVAPGRIWAHLSCPRMVNQTGVLVQRTDGTFVPETCDGEVDFLFENCSM
jgi:hypothetical protein